MPIKTNNQSNKVALITGAAKRIGRQIALELHQNDIDIGIHYHHSQEQAEELCRYLNHRRPNSAHLFGFDLQRNEAQKQLIDDLIKHFGKLDYLVNNASIFYPTPFTQNPETELAHFLRINTVLPVKLIQLAAPFLKLSIGSVVNIIDIYAERGLAEHASYVASKSALLTLTKQLATELAPQITVNAVSPGAILWPQDNSMNDSNKAALLDNTALKRLGNAEDISQTVAFLLLQGKYMTGCCINVDGGRSLYI